MRAPGRGTRGWIRLEVLFGLLAAALLLFVGLPLLLLFPEVSFDELRLQIQEGGLARAIGVSVGSASAATALAAALGIPAAYLLAHTQSRASWLARAILVLPTVLPPVAAGVLLLSAYGPGGPVAGLFGGEGWTLVNAFGGIVIAQLFVTTPFVVLTAEAAFRSVDPLLQDVARTLGQTPGRTFARVSLPLARYGLLAGLVLGWMRALGEFGATVVLAYHPHSLPVYLWRELTGTGLAGALPVALAALVIALLALAAAEALARTGFSRRREPPASELLGPAHRPREGTPVRSGSGAARRDRVAGVRPDAAADRPARELVPEPTDAVLLEADLSYRIDDFRLGIQLRAGAEILSLFGPSGAGKSTLLRLVAGLLDPDVGSVRLGGALCFDRSEGQAARALPTSRRQVGMVFQESALFPHLDVARNILFGASREDVSAGRLLPELVALTRLEGLEHRYPHELSGGQQQRVALARALARRPRVVLLDEPFSSLDFNMKERLHQDVRRIQSAYGLCVLYVTHDLRDACSLGDRLAVMAGGRLLQVGPPLDVLRRPESFDVARFVAVRNILPATVEGVTDAGCLVRCGNVTLDTAVRAFTPGASVYACIRPEDVVLLKPDRPLASPADENVLGGVIVGQSLRGPTFSLEFRVGDPGQPDPLTLEIELPVRSYDALGIAPGREWRVSLRRSVIHLVPRPAAAGVSPAPGLRL